MINQFPSRGPGPPQGQQIPLNMMMGNQMMIPCPPMVPTISIMPSKPRTVSILSEVISEKEANISFCPIKGLPMIDEMRVRTIPGFHIISYEAGMEAKQKGSYEAFGETFECTDLEILHKDDKVFVCEEDKKMFLTKASKEYYQYIHFELEAKKNERQRLFERNEERKKLRARQAEEKERLEKLKAEEEERDARIRRKKELREKEASAIRNRESRFSGPPTATSAPGQMPAYVTPVTAAVPVQDPRSAQSKIPHFGGSSTVPEVVQAVAGTPVITDAKPVRESRFAQQPGVPIVVPVAVTSEPVAGAPVVNSTPSYKQDMNPTNIPSRSVPTVSSVPGATTSTTSSLSGSYGKAGSEQGQGHAKAYPSQEKPKVLSIPPWSDKKKSSMASQQQQGPSSTVSSHPGGSESSHQRAAPYPPTTPRGTPPAAVRRNGNVDPRLAHSQTEGPVRPLMNPPQGMPAVPLPNVVKRPPPPPPGYGGQPPSYGSTHPPAYPHHHGGPPQAYPTAQPSYSYTTTSASNGPQRPPPANSARPPPKHPTMSSGPVRPSKETPPLAAQKKVAPAKPAESMSSQLNSLLDTRDFDEFV